MSLYLLDADVVIDFLDGVEPATGFLRRLTAARHDLLLTPITSAEVFAGTAPADRASVAAILAGFQPVDLTIAIGRKAGEYRWDFARLGRPIPTTDALQAGAAFVLGAALVTRNVRHFPMTDITVIPPD